MTYDPFRTAWHEALDAAHGLPGGVAVDVVEAVVHAGGEALAACPRQRVGAKSNAACNGGVTFH